MLVLALLACEAINSDKFESNFDSPQMWSFLIRICLDIPASMFTVVSALSDFVKRDYLITSLRLRYTLSVIFGGTSFLVAFFLRAPTFTVYVREFYAGLSILSTLSSFAFCTVDQTAEAEEENREHVRIYIDEVGQYIHSQALSEARQVPGSQTLSVDDPPDFPFRPSDAVTVEVGT
jgi:hypothetical protein